MRKLKLLFYIQGLSGGGAERVLSILANKFVEQGHFVRIAYTTYAENNVYTLDKRIEECWLFRRRKGNTIIKIFNRIHYQISKFKLIRNQALSYQPDVVISFLTSTNNDVIMSLLGTKIPVVVCEHSKVSRWYGFKTNLLRLCLYRFATAVTVLTKSDYKKWEKKYNNLYYMPNPIVEATNISKEIERRNIVLAVGRITSWKIKGFDLLINCWEKIYKDFPDWKLMIAGSYSQSSLGSLKKAIPTGALEHVELLGFRNDVGEIMSRSKVFCLSSRVEGFPMVLGEAMKRGCCCVSFDIDAGPNEMIEDGYSGLLVKDQDIDDLECKLRKVLNDNVLQEKYAENAPSSVEKYSIKATTDRWELMLHNL